MLGKSSIKMIFFGILSPVTVGQKEGERGQSSAPSKQTARSLGDANLHCDSLFATFE